MEEILVHAVQISIIIEASCILDFISEVVKYSVKIFTFWKTEIISSRKFGFVQLLVIFYT